MSNKKYDLENRLVEFAANIVFLCKEMPHDMAGNYYGNQLLRSAGSSALNFGEAQGTNTVKDQINKLALVLKELKESRVNLKILHRSCLRMYSAISCKCLISRTKLLFLFVALATGIKRAEVSRDQ